jgi:hypothetical protein
MKKITIITIPLILASPLAMAQESSAFDVSAPVGIIAILAIFLLAKPRKKTTKKK